MANKIVTAEDARALLRYDADTGFLYWLPRSDARGIKRKIDSAIPAGHLAQNGYIMLNVGGKLHRAHRVIWLMVHGHWPENTIDHVNRVRSDNRLVNLREATRRENQQNHPVRTDNKSGHRGVFWHHTANLWWAYINHAGKRTTVGYFKDKDDAIAARKAAEQHMYTHVACS